MLHSLLQSSLQLASSMSPGHLCVRRLDECFKGTKYYTCLHAVPLQTHTEGLDRWMSDMLLDAIFILARVNTKVLK